jgi:hypothetical protein
VAPTRWSLQRSDASAVRGEPDVRLPRCLRHSTSTIDGNIFALRQRRYTPLGKVCQHDTIREECPYIWSESDSCVGAGGVMTTLRILIVIYVVQAGVGIATGVSYALWVLYW